MSLEKSASKVPFVEAVAFASALSPLTPAIFAAQETFVRLVSHLNLTDKELTILGLTLTAATVATSTAFESYLLRRRKISANPISVALNETLHQEIIASALGHLYFTFIGFFTNPVDLLHTSQYLTGVDQRLFQANLTARVLTGFSLEIFVNFLIATGRADRFLQLVDLLVSKSIGIADDFYHSSGLKQIDLAMFPPQYPLWPDDPTGKLNY